MKHLLFFIAAFCSFVSLANSPQIQVTELGKDVFVLTPAYGTNIGLFKTSAGVVLIDPMPGDDQLAALEQQVAQLAGAPVAFILNTHDHSDHSGGNAYFIKKGAVLIADGMPFTEFQPLLASSHTALDKVFYHKKSNSIFVGDIYDSSWHPTFYAGGLAGFNKAIDAILTLGDDNSLIIPGHGKPKGKAELRAFQRNTLAWVARVKTLNSAGKTAAEIKVDAQIKLMLEKFNPDNNKNFIPEKALFRFIERTLVVIEKDQ